MSNTGDEGRSSRTVPSAKEAAASWADAAETASGYVDAPDEPEPLAALPDPLDADPVCGTAEPTGDGTDDAASVLSVKSFAAAT